MSFKRNVRQALSSYKDKELNDTEVRILYGLRSRNFKKQENMVLKKEFGDNIKKSYSELKKK
jgi:hypothetical protein